LKIKTNVKAGDGTGAADLNRITANHNQTVAYSLKVKTNVKAGGETQQHNQTVANSLKVKTDVKAGGSAGTLNVGSDPTLMVARGLKIKTGIKAGPDDPPIIRG
jgi:hypothetical protein